MRTLLQLAFLGGLAITLSACGTMYGVGEDVGFAGAVIENAASPRPFYY